MSKWEKVSDLICHGCVVYVSRKRSMTRKPLPYIAHQRKADGAEQSVEEHLLGVAETAKSFAAKIRLGEQGELIGLLHDLGKYSREFQTYFRSAVGLLN